MDSLAQRLRDLNAFLPLGSFDALLPLFRQHSIHLTITRARKTRRGDYRAPAPGKHDHRISVNGNLHPYAFLLTLLHEIAHLQVYESHNRSVRPHGPEWKKAFGVLLFAFADKGIFPQPLEAAVRKAAASPASATCYDPELSRALRAYDPEEQALPLAETLPVGAVFKASDGHHYTVLERRRSRLRCRRLKDGREYLVSFLSEVEIIQLPSQKGAVT